jgi:release factor glutamine methyltransferase
MLTVLESLELSTEYLKKKGIKSPRMNAELLLSHILKCGRMDLYLRFNQPLNNAETELYRNYILRRGNFEPYQYIVGEVEFYGLKFFVDNNVLIPRQETEILVETVINDIPNGAEQKILDIGTGSGNIAITLAKKLPQSKVISVDVSAEAIKTAERNRKLHDVKKRVGFMNTDILTDNLEKYYGVFDVVVSNPPYVEIDEFDNLQKEITDFEPKIALTDFSDGLKFYKNIIMKSKNWLAAKGRLYFELGEGQAKNVENLLLQNGFEEIKIIKDYSDINRVISAVKSA